MILEIPLLSVEIGGNLNTYYYNNVILRSDITQSTENGTAKAEGFLTPSISEVANILTEGGETYQYLMAIKAPIALLDLDVPEGLPKRTTLDGTATEVPKAFKNWLVPGSEIWKKDDDTEIIFYTNPFAGNADSYLKGSEIKIINDINQSIDVLTISEAEIETQTGWTKL